ncbi:SPX-domain-containing protein [Aaosphaeria arxii CBS 175.79]|uniref:SPX-domain-containing protein n=1 Tax=Aaosphaeria arxii CBS 175.79 TaxID=1450172 RepID=A0A6A5XVH5_9PLEO|nr:SPX-domain-containing protein [Aaosphaeria arxii CBS 175.79]KAF2016711.1 SPX-domain-containing protein [Aaosphaeria arxii CBS 175.79]
MRFGTTLRKSIYPPWKAYYVDYEKLKKLLKDSDDSASPIDEDDDKWTDEDETAFVDELIHVQLEKVHRFQSEVAQKLRDRTTACEKKLEPLAVGIKGDQQQQKDDGAQTYAEAAKPEPAATAKQELKPEEREKLLKEVLAELDDITKEVNELEKYSRINYTAFFKATKKHDRKRGGAYRLRAFLETRLAAHPLNKEDHSPLLFRLSAMYSFVRQSLEGKTSEALSFAESTTGGESFTSHKFWIHKDNILEVKTVILRRLPVLVYNPQTSKVAEGSQRDPTLTSIYFDNPKFSLYTDKVNHTPNAGSLRLRWYGQLAEKPEIVFEKKEIKDGDASEEQRFPIKEKYIEQFIEGKYKMEKTIQKMEYQKKDAETIEGFKKAVDDIQSFIKKNELQPVLRANYTRTAFQIPGDDRVRISLDTNLATIREDSLDHDRPCRDPEDWHRRDIDGSQMEYPFKAIRKGEINRFPYALLEIKTKGMKKYEWIEDLMNSHLVKETPRFSKFVHGVAMLFDDNVNTFPFWLSDIDTDIRQEPQQAFEEEQERKKKAAEDDFAVGSLFGAKASPSYRPSVTSPVGSPVVSKSLTKRATSNASGLQTSQNVSDDIPSNGKKATEEPDSDEDDEGTALLKNPFSQSTGLRSLFPSFTSNSKYARAKQQDRIQLPPGVRDPGVWIKDQGPVRVEAKVWLANQRTYIKWQHVSVLLASLSLGLYNAAGEDNNIARSLAVVYTLIAAFTLAWGWGMYMWRMKLIKQRSGTDFDNVVGPMVVCVGLAVALVLNFAFKYNAIVNDKNRHAGHSSPNATLSGGERIELVR